MQKAGDLMSSDIMSPALVRFHEKDVFPSLEQALNDLEQDFQKNLCEMKKQYIECFKIICLNTAKIQENGQSRIGFLIFHLLRTRILSHDYTYAVMAYDKDWYLNEGVRVGEADFSFIYKHYEELWKKLERESKKYIGQINGVDIEGIMLKLLNPFHLYVAELMRCSLLEALETSEYEALDREKHFEIQTGEYFELCDLVHMEDKEKDLEERRQRLEQSKDQSCCFQDFRNLDLKGQSYCGRDLRYADFRKSSMEEIQLRNCLLIGARFKESDLRGASLMVSMIHDASFEKADLTRGKLQYCVAFTGKNHANEWKNTGFTGVSFKNAILKEADFSGATIMGGDFEGADLRGAIFKDAVLYRSRFNKKQLDECEFSQEQLEQIKLLP
ncbi:pentapeptide repeat-containing protein [Lacrimispora amygdalina]